MSPIGLCAFVVYHGFLQGGNYTPSKHSGYCLTSATRVCNNRIMIT
ncbi:hypothetical protein VPHK459_0041 [Vibrio phage K459]